MQKPPLFLSALTWAGSFCWVAVRRAVELFVFFPAAVAAVVMLLALAIGIHPLRGIVGGIVDIADLDIRTAEPGKVWISKCVQPTKSSLIAKVPTAETCADFGRIQIPTGEAIDFYAGQILTTYSIVVLFGMILIGACFSLGLTPRHYFGGVRDDDHLFQKPLERSSFDRKESSL